MSHDRILWIFSNVNIDSLLAEMNVLHLLFIFSITEETRPVEKSSESARGETNAQPTDMYIVYLYAMI